VNAIPFLSELKTIRHIPTVRQVRELVVAEGAGGSNLAADGRDRLVNRLANLKRNLTTLDGVPIGASNGARDGKHVVDGAAQDVGTRGQQGNGRCHNAEEDFREADTVRWMLPCESTHRGAHVAFAEHARSPAGGRFILAMRPTDRCIALLATVTKDPQSTIHSVTPPGSTHMMLHSNAHARGQIPTAANNHHRRGSSHLVTQKEAATKSAVLASRTTMSSHSG
jgi:hypothetical protein